MAGGRCAQAGYLLCELNRWITRKQSRPKPGPERRPQLGLGRPFQVSRLRAYRNMELSSVPSAWTLALSYVGNGSEIDGPGNMAIDRDGNVWSTTNNYTFNADDSLPACAGGAVSELTPTGADAPGAPFSGGGVSGAGFGIAIDTIGNVWVSNFGFAGTGCAQTPPADSVSELSGLGTVLSAASGFTQGPIAAPQGTAVDQGGNVWIANFGNNTVTEYPNGNANGSIVIGSARHLVQPSMRRATSFLRTRVRIPSPSFTPMAALPPVRHY